MNKKFYSFESRYVILLSNCQSLVQVGCYNVAIMDLELKEHFMTLIPYNTL